MADVAAALASWSATSASNSPTGGTSIAAGLDDNMREMQGATVRGLSHKGADIASAATTDIGAIEGLAHDITGTTTITAFGTVRVGIWKILKFEGALTLTHNATSLILLTGANRTTVAGDVGFYMSEGSGNWREHLYMPVNTQLTNSGVKFAASQAASADVNTLDDYEEGSWTPVLTAATPGDISVAYTTQTGTYTKIGRMVTVFFNITPSSFTHSTASGAAQITGLPFTVANTAFICVGAMVFSGITKANYTNYAVEAVPNTALLQIGASGSAQASGQLAISEIPSGGTVVLIGSVSFNV